jgi:hypothetical protein
MSWLAGLFSALRFEAASLLVMTSLIVPNDSANQLEPLPPTCTERGVAFPHPALLIHVGVEESRVLNRNFEPDVDKGYAFLIAIQS